MIKGVAESTGTSNEMGNVGSEKECTHICKTGCQAVLSQIKLAKSRARSINLAGIHLEKSQQMCHVGIFIAEIPRRPTRSLPLDSAQQSPHQSFCSSTLQSYLSFNRAALLQQTAGSVILRRRYILKGNVFVSLLYLI